MLVLLAAVFCGFSVMSFLVMIFIGLISSLFHVKPTIPWLLLTATAGACFAISGGYVTAWIPLYVGEPVDVSVQAVMGLVSFTAVMSGLCILGSLLSSQPEQEPVWFHLLTLVTSNICIVKGASMVIPSSLLSQQQYFLSNLIGI